MIQKMRQQILAQSDETAVGILSMVAKAEANREAFRQNLLWRLLQRRKSLRPTRKAFQLDLKVTLLGRTSLAIRRRADQPKPGTGFEASTAEAGACCNHGNQRSRHHRASDPRSIRAP